MLIRCYGARGSIPVSGAEYLKYGGDTACFEIRTGDDQVIIIDAGSGIRRLGSRLLAEKRYKYNLIFTHTHWDHILGFPFFRPIYVKGVEMEFFGCPFAQDSVKNMISKTMAPPNFPVNFDDVAADFIFHGLCETAFSIGSVVVTPILLSHPNQGIGYRFTENGKSFVFLTDNELTFRHPGGLEYADYLRFSTGADLLIHDSEYTEEDYVKTRAWGHSVYKDALRLALEAGVKKFGLYHHNQERVDAAVDEIVQDCRRIIKGQKSGLECFAVSQDMEITL